MTDSTNPSPECKPLSDVAANALSWIMVLTALDPGAKWALAALWCRAVDDGGTFVSLATREEIAARSGQGVVAVKKQLARLGSAGWVRRRGHVLELAWRMPFEVGAQAALDGAQETSSEEPASDTGPARTQTTTLSLAVTVSLRIDGVAK